MSAPKDSLFNESSINQIETDQSAWLDTALSEADRAAEGSFFTHSGIPVKLLFTPADVKDMSHARDLGFPGQAPFVRGVYPNMYRGRLFTVGRARLLSGLPPSPSVPRRR